MSGMTHPDTNPLAVIEQLVEALDHCMGAITERGLNGSPDQAEKWGLQLPLVRAESAITAAQSMLAHPTPSTTGEAEPEWNDENVIAYCIARGISAAKAFTTGATQPQATEPAPRPFLEINYPQAALTEASEPAQTKQVLEEFEPLRAIEPASSTAGERDNKTEMLAKLTAWLDSLGGKLHTYSLRGIALAGFEKGWSAALMQSTADHIAQNRKLVAALPVGELPEPFHPSASHINPDYRDGWNAALAAARSQPVREPLTLEELELCRQWFNSVQDTNGGYLGKTEMLAKLTAWLDSLGGKLHTYSLRGIALAGFEKGWSAALMQSTAMPAKQVMQIPDSYGPLDANALERVAKEHPDQYFLKGSGVLKLIAAIRELEQKATPAAMPVGELTVPSIATPAV